MKARDKRRMYAILTLLASIAVAIATALSVTYVALGFLFVYIKDRFPEWNEKRKAEMKAKKLLQEQDDKKPSLFDKIKSKFNKPDPEEQELEDIEPESQPFDNYEYSMTPPQVDSNRAFIMGEGASYVPNNGFNVPQYPDADRNDGYEDDLNSISASSNKKHLFRKK